MDSLLADLLDDEFRGVVSQALIAYNAMETTKRRHFDYLNLLESKRKKFNLDATAEEAALLAALLSDHDQTVKHFKSEAQFLQKSAPAAHIALFKYIGMLNEVLGDSAESDTPSH